ncbi:MAG: hypothetical protein H6747_15485 [Deltaproteobacteria bacterium]|nr:hypothetical protein [Deltaproteobacteria bacterium]
MSTEREGAGLIAALAQAGEDLLGCHSMVACRGVDNRTQRAELERVVNWHSDVMLTVPFRRQSHVTAGLDRLDEDDDTRRVVLDPEFQHE